MYIFVFVCLFLLDAEKSISEIVSVFANTLVVPKELELLAENAMNSASKVRREDAL